jgi:hypothetical protein
MVLKAIYCYILLYIATYCYIDSGDVDGRWGGERSRRAGPAKIAAAIEGHDTKMLRLSGRPKSVRKSEAQRTRWPRPLSLAERRRAGQDD